MFHEAPAEWNMKSRELNSNSCFPLQVQTTYMYRLFTQYKQFHHSVLTDSGSVSPAAITLKPFHSLTRQTVHLKKVTPPFLCFPQIYLSLVLFSIQIHERRTHKCVSVVSTYSVHSNCVSLQYRVLCSPLT